MENYQETESSGQKIIIFGASVRAAAFSALRAGLQPWCADLFADVDLQARCVSQRVSSGDYPDEFVVISEKTPSGPWMYTGGLENHPSVVQRISQRRPLWGNNADNLALARSPSFLAEVFQTNGICFPKTLPSLKAGRREGRWLRKPFRGAGGHRIHFVSAQTHRILSRDVYCQEFLEGIPCSAVYVGLEKNTHFFGATRQLVGETWLNAAPFHYCGSVGPLKLEVAVQKKLEKIGEVLHRHCHLRGLFGVDFILTDEIPWPVEVNPRYPASAEILEHAGVQVMSFHRSVFDSSTSEISRRSMFRQGAISKYGKAILFANESLNFPADGPWRKTLEFSSAIDDMPNFADIPAPGTAIKAGHPILTFFSRSDSVTACIENLKDIAQDLDHLIRTT